MMSSASAVYDVIDPAFAAARMLPELTAVPLGSFAEGDMLRDDIIGRSAALKAVLVDVELVAPTDAAVLICGETGTGKELIARAIHNGSGRRAHSLVKCNCAAIPAGLLESELFGYEKGAFTGASLHRVGRFELADRGTIFLDEIGEAPPELQPKLLRVLQEGEFERLGSSRTIKTDARLITATNVDLPEMVEAKTFRADLYYRLNVFPIRVPALRDRREDIPALVCYFARHYAIRMRRPISRISTSVMNALVEYPWPGNIRELQNVIQRAVIRSSGDLLDVPMEEIREATPAASIRAGTLKEAERAHILAALKEAQWVISGPRGAATRLGINRSTLQFRMRRLGIERPFVPYEARP
jgi:formate hydrogenlyase transcriptional activator